MSKVMDPGLEKPWNLDHSRKFPGKASNLTLTTFKNHWLSYFDVCMVLVFVSVMENRDILFKYISVIGKYISIEAVSRMNHRI